MEVQISPASSFNSSNKNMLRGSAVPTHEPTPKRFKSDLTFHCIVCSDIYDDPNVLYEHMKKQHPELYERDQNGQDNDDVFDVDEDDDDETDENDTNEFYLDETNRGEFIDENYSDLSRILEPICELRHEGDDDDECIDNVHNSSITSNGAALQTNGENGLAVEHQLRLQLQLQLQLQNHLLQQTEAAKKINDHSKTDETSSNISNDVVARPLALRKYFKFLENKLDEI